MRAPSSAGELLSTGRPMPAATSASIGPDAVVQACPRLERHPPVVVRTAVAPQHVVAQVEVEHPARADDPDLDRVPVARRTDVARLPAHRADRAARVADRDRVVELDLRVERRRHQREHVLAAQVVSHSETPSRWVSWAWP